MSRLALTSRRGQIGPYDSLDAAVFDNASHHPNVIFIIVAAVFCSAFLVYVVTLAPTITWRNGGIDSGELVTAIATLGIPHPSGFPTYVLVGKLISFLPIGELAYRVNLMSAAFGALTAATLFAIICLVSVWRNDSWAAMTAALLFAFSPLFWSRATVAKEYTLHLWFVSMVPLCLIVWRRTKRRRYLTALGVVLGLASGNHPTVLSVLPATVAFILLARSPDETRPSLSALLWPAVLAVVVAAVTYSYLPLRAAQHPLLNWDNPVTAAGFFAHVTGSAYVEILQTADPSAVIRRVAFAFSQIPTEYGWPAGVCLLTGAWTLASRDRAVSAFAAVLAGENILFASLYPTRDSEVYLLPAYLMGSIAVGVGLADVMSELQRISRSLIRATFGRTWLVSFGLAALLVGSQIQRNFALVDLSRDTTARDYAVAVLRSVEPGSVILTNQDATTFSLWYVWQALDQRPDVVVVDERLLDWNWYRESVDYSYPGLHLVDPSSATEDQLHNGQASGRPVYRARAPDLALGHLTLPVIEKVGP